MAERTARKSNEEKYLVLTGDVVRSRDVPDREALRASLVRVLRKLNRASADMVLVPLSITAGDEFQGVFRPDGKIVALVDAVEREFFPVQVRVGIGIGEIATRFTRRSQEMDGPAFVLARAALDATRKFRPDAWLQFRTPDKKFDLAANAIAALLGHIKQRWEAVHWRRAALRDQKLDVTEIAEREGVTQGAVSHTLRTAGYEVVRRVEADLSKLIDSRWAH